jgi:2-methylcitrate dehydratase
MDAMTERLVDYALACRFEALPQDAVHACKRHLIDTLGCALGAYDEPFCARTRAFAARYRGEPGASVWGTAQPVSAEMAAYANGVMLRYLDLNDMYRVRAGGHPSDTMAALLAVGESVRAPGAEVVNAILLAYEIYCGFCEALDANSLGWDQPLYGVMAAALGAGRLLGLDRKAMGDALALALVPNMPLLQTRRGELSGWKGCAAANACRNGIFAALLARDGFDGPTAAFEGRFGLCDAVGRFDWPRFGGEGAAHRLPRCHMKRYPLCYHGQGAVQLASALRVEAAGREPAEIHVEVYRTAVEEMANDATRWAPRSRETADHSLPYVTALGLLDGDVTPASFGPERLRDERLARLMAVTRVTEDPALTAKYPACAPARVSLRFADGGRLTRACDLPAGHARSPLSDAEVEAKFRGLFSGYGSPRQCDRVLAALWAFEQVADTGEVIALLRR